MLAVLLPFVDKAKDDEIATHEIRGKVVFSLLIKLVLINLQWPKLVCGSIKSSFPLPSLNSGVVERNITASLMGESSTILSLTRGSLVGKNSFELSSSTSCQYL